MAGRMVAPFGTWDLEMKEKFFPSSYGYDELMLVRFFHASCRYMVSGFPDAAKAMGSCTTLGRLLLGTRSLQGYLEIFLLILLT